VIHYEMRDYFDFGALHAPWLVRNEELEVVLNTLKNIHREFARMNGTLPGTLLCGPHPRIGRLMVKL